MRFVKKGRMLAVIVLAIVSTGGVVALPYVDAIGFIVRAADIPGTAAALAAMFLGERITVPTMVAGGLIIAGVYLTTSNRLRPL